MRKVNIMKQFINLASYVYMLFTLIPVQSGEVLAYKMWQVLKKICLKYKKYAYLIKIAISRSLILFLRHKKHEFNH